MNSISYRASAPVIAALALFLAVTTPARAQDAPVGRDNGVAAPYVNGGIGKDDESHMRAIARQWPLRMTFSERRDNEFVAGVRLDVRDAKGASVLAVHQAGPITYAKLPAGTYRITASLHGVAQRRTVTLRAGQGRDVHFHWKG